jgi:peptide deformylase
MDESAEKNTKCYRHFVARITQHKINHLKGVLFVYRVRGLRDLYSENEYLKRVHD